jgi:hypothetical protein
VEGLFDSVTVAPSGIYADSAVVLGQSGIVIVQAVRNGTADACQFDISPYIYTKIRVDSIDVDSRSVLLHAVLDPNCGFRSFESGIPAR